MLSSLIMPSKPMTAKDRDRMFLLSLFIITAAFAFFMVMAHADAVADSKGTVQDLVTQMIKIIGMIFTAVGVILAVYAVGTLILAFKNEDADSKSRASTLLVVSVVLIAFPSIVNGLDLVKKIGG